MDMTSTATVHPAIKNAAVSGKAARGADNMTSIDKAAKDFEAMFMSQMLQPMFDSMEVDETFGGGHGEQVMRGLLVQEYGKAMASTGSFGLSSAIKDEMIRMQAQKKQSQMAAAASAASSYATAGALQ